MSGKGQLITGEGLPGLLPGCASPLRAKAMVTSEDPPTPFLSTDAHGPLPQTQCAPRAQADS